MHEDPHPLLMRATYMHGAGYLPLGRMAAAKIENLKREEKDFARVLTRCEIGFIQAGDDFVAAGGRRRSIIKIVESMNLSA